MTNNTEIYTKLADKLHAFIISRVHDKSVADDILQELFVKIHSKIDTVADQTKLQSWIYQICRNLISDYFRSLQKNLQAKQLLFESEYDDNSDDFMVETLEDMIKMMGNLPAEYCEAICLTQLEGMSQTAYAEKIGISYSAAKSRVQRGRKMLKDLLMNCCHYEFDKYGTAIGIYPVNCCCCHKS